jgi:hypothetical protein
MSIFQDLPIMIYVMYNNLDNIKLNLIYIQNLYIINIFIMIITQYFTYINKIVHSIMYITEKNVMLEIVF